MVAAFRRVQNVPHGYWNVFIEDNLDVVNMPGYHVTDAGTPFAMVKYEPGWELTVSHECLEMISDPYGLERRPGFSINPGREEQRVDYLVAVCDPCQNMLFAYMVDDVTVSDFCTPDYYGPSGTSCGRYSFTGNVQSPQQVLEKGYVSFFDEGNWFRADRNNGVLNFLSLASCQVR